VGVLGVWGVIRMEGEWKALNNEVEEGRIGET